MHRAAATALALGVAAAGCGGEGDDPLQVTVLDGDPRVAVADLQGAFDIRYTGTLRYEEQSGCLFLESGDGRSAVVWPIGTRPAVASDGRRGADVPGHGVIAEGDRLEIAGAGGPWGGTERDQDVIAASSELVTCIEPGDLLVTVWRVEELDRRAS